MADDSFHRFITSAGAHTARLPDTPFALYELHAHRLQFHYIDFRTYREHDIPDDFLVRFFTAAGRSGYKVITIWEDVWHNRQSLVTARILAMIGQRARIHARQTEVVRLDKETVASFLDQHHLQDHTSAYYKFGLRAKGELVAAATFSKARTMYDGPVYYRSFEMERFASRQGLTVTGGLGKLLAHFISELDAKHLMTYADADWSNGEGYARLGFTFVEHTLPQRFIIDPEKLTRTYLHHSAVPAENGKGLLVVANTGSLKFVLTSQKT